MPTPIGHIFAGAILYKAQKKESIWLLMFIFFFALLPDVDFVFGFVAGDPNRYHHLFTHSFFFVIVAGVVGGWFYAKWKNENAVFASAIYTIAGISHVLLDILAADKREPYGCPLWWPFSNEFVISPALLFSDVSRVSDSKVFIQSLFNVHNLKTIFIETAVLLPIFLLVLFTKKKIFKRS